MYFQTESTRNSFVYPKLRVVSCLRRSASAPGALRRPSSGALSEPLLTRHACLRCPPRRPPRTRPPAPEEVIPAWDARCCSSFPFGRLLCLSRWILSVFARRGKYPAMTIRARSVLRAAGVCVCVPAGGSVRGRCVNICSAESDKKYGYDRMHITCSHFSI